MELAIHSSGLLRPSRLLRIPLGLAAVLALAAGAGAQEPSFTISGPEEILELEGSYRVGVHGAHVDDATPAVRVLVDGVDVTSQLTVSVTDETKLDEDQDGLLESYSAKFEIAFGAFDPEPGELVVTQFTVGAPGGSDVRQTSATVRSHLRVAVDDTLYSGDPAVHVAVRTRRLAVESQSLRVFLDDVEVTSQVAITGPELAYEIVEPGSPDFVRYRMQRYWVDLSALGSIDGKAVRFSASATAAGASTSSAGSSAGAGPQPAPLDACQKKALDDFVDALHPALPTMESVIRDAAKTLQDALADCEAQGSPAFGMGARKYTTPGGIDLVIDLGGGSGGDAMASGEADLVVAIASPGEGSGDGGNAEASNTQPGGVAIAVGGDGGSGASKGGDGGSATAEAVPDGNQPPGGTAIALGGDGGRAAPASGTGGDGGKASGKFDGNETIQLGSKGSPGYHGGGGWLFRGDSGTSGKRGPWAN